MPAHSRDSALAAPHPSSSATAYLFLRAARPGGSVGGGGGGEGGGGSSEGGSSGGSDVGASGKGASGGPIKASDPSRASGASQPLGIALASAVAAVLLIAAVLFFVRKRAVAARQPHRDASMPTVGDGDEAEVEA